MFVGATIFAYGLSNMCELVMNLDPEARLITQLQDNLRATLESRNMSNDVRHRTKLYLLHRYYSSNIEMFGALEELDHLAANHKAEVYLEIWYKFFGYVKLMHKMPEHVIRLIAGRLDGKCYGPHDVIL